MIKAILFDVDGVLLDSFEANLKFFQNLMAWAGYPGPTREEFPQIFPLTMWDGIKAITKLTDEQKIQNIWDEGKTDRILYPIELLKMPDHAEQTIQMLSHSHDLAIVTSRVRDGIYEIPGLLKLKSYFKVAVAYEDTVRHKPDPEPLLLAAKRLDAAPHESVYIGDVENDMKAAKAAGMKGILYAKHTVKEADACTSSFAQLPELIQSL